MKEEDIKKMVIDDVVRWILANSDNTELMDKINKLTFAFTSKYKNYVGGSDGTSSDDKS